MDCVIRKSPKQLRKGMLIHTNTCKTPFLYLGWTKKGEGVDRGFQFLRLGDPVNDKYLVVHRGDVFPYEKVHIADG